jgi:hypothetical protein
MVIHDGQAANNLFIALRQEKLKLGMLVEVMLSGVEVPKRILDQGRDPLGTVPVKLEWEENELF